jgi:hypothetical protein
MLIASILSVSSTHALEKSNYQPSIDVNQRVSEIDLNKEQHQLTSTSCAAYFKETVNADNCREGEVPLPAASWLFLLALIGFVGLSNKRKI